LTTPLVVFLVSFLAFSLSAVCGGGASLILIPLLGNQILVSRVPAALSIGTLTGSTSRILAFSTSIRWEIVRWFVPAAIPAVWLGAWSLKFINPVYLGIILGIFLISNIPFVFRKEKQLHLVSRPKNVTLFMIGFLAGFFSGLTGAVGLLFNKFYLRYQLSKEEIVATRAANEVILHLIKIVLYSLFGLITSNVIFLGLVVAASAICSTITMKFILPRISEIFFKRLGYLAMVISGFVMLEQSGGNLLKQNSGYIVSKPVSNGLETKLKWQNSNFALEFTYDEGFELEQVIPFSELSKAQQALVDLKKADATRIVIEVVYSIGETSYEAYYYKDNNFLSKIEFS